MKNLTTTALLLLVCSFLHAQVSITRIDGVGAGNNFLDVSDATRFAMFNGTTGGEITYLPDQGPIRVTVTDPNSFTIGNYELTLIDEELTNSTLDTAVFWQLTHLQWGTTVVSDLPITEASEQYVPEYGITIKVAQVPDAGEMGTNNGAIGVSLEYEDPQGPQWFSGIEENYDVNHLDYIQTDLGEIDYELDPEQDFSQMGEGFFTPYTLCNWRPSASSFNYLSPSWISPNSAIVRVGNGLDSLNNVDIVFTSNKDLWSRCVILETASPEYYNELGLATEYNTGQDCSPINMDLRGALSVSPNDVDLDGLPDPDGETYMGEPRVGMGWFPGYAIDVESGKRLNILFGENSTYSLDQDTALLSQYGISADDFETGPAGRDMLWNPNAQKEIDAGDADGFPYQYYLGGQHYIYVTRQAYDEGAEFYDRLHCDANTIQSIFAFRTITWTAIPVLAEGSALLSLADGLIPNDLVVKLRVDNPFRVIASAGQFNGYPTYEFEIDETLISTNDPLEYDWMTSLAISPNPYSLGGHPSLQLHHLPTDCTVTLFDLAGQRLWEKAYSSIPASSVTSIASAELPKLNKGVYFVRVQEKGKRWKTLKWVVM